MGVWRVKIQFSLSWGSVEGFVRNDVTSPKKWLADVTDNSMYWQACFRASQDEQE